MPFGQSCYSFHANAKTFHEAQEICKKKGKVLVEIETQEENDMISELLFQSSLTSTKMDQVVIKWFIFLNTLSFFRFGQEELVAILQEKMFGFGIQTQIKLWNTETSGKVGLEETELTDPI